MTTRGFILGKFLPPHAGHVWLCQTAAQLVDELTILVCSLDREPIVGQLRYEWMQALLPNCRIIWYCEDAPQEPSEHPDFWNIWKKICKDVHPQPVDYVFGSEAYITRLAEELDAKPVIVDPKRSTISVSGTDIRNNPAKHWEFIPSIVRPYYQKRVVLFGSESVGKTTLAQQLAERLGTLYVPEYGRAYTEVDEPEIWTASDFTIIAERHLAMRKATEPIAGPILIEDTDPLLTCVWQEMLTGEAADWIRGVELPDLYLFLQPDIDWVDDGTRYFSKSSDQKKFQALCVKVLEQVGARYVLISGNGSERLKAAELAIKNALNAA